MRFPLAIVSSVVLVQAAYAASSESASASAIYALYATTSVSASSVAEASSSPRLAGSLEKRNFFDYIKKINFASASASVAEDSYYRAAPSLDKCKGNMQDILASIEEYSLSTDNVSSASVSTSVSKTSSIKCRNRAAARVSAQNASRSAAAHVTPSGKYNNYKRSAMESQSASVPADAFAASASHSVNHYTRAIGQPSTNVQEEMVYITKNVKDEEVSASAKASTTVQPTTASSSASAAASVSDFDVESESMIVANVQSQIEAILVLDKVFAAIDESAQVVAPIVDEKVADIDVDNFWIADALAEAQFKGYDWKANN